MPFLYATSSFFNCYRTHEQIFEVLDIYVQQNPSILTKFAISSTVRNRTIWAYKLSTRRNLKALYIQSLIHAREWVTGSSTVYALSRWLDDISNKRTAPTDTYDLIIVPVLNIDGYEISWTTDRYQRKNANGVDLNRNYPTHVTNPWIVLPSDEEYPGPSVFSERESRGIRDYLAKENTKIDGYVDVHSYGGEVLFPYGNTRVPHKDDTKYKIMAKNVASVMGYVPLPAWTGYLAYGMFIDWVSRVYDKPAILFEMAGTDFVHPISSIRVRGDELYNGLAQFVNEVKIFIG
jgi:murein tripeptide amidase MpaA